MFDISYFSLHDFQFQFFSFFVIEAGCIFHHFPGLNALAKTAHELARRKDATGMRSVMCPQESQVSGSSMARQQAEQECITACHLVHFSWYSIEVFPENHCQCRNADMKYFISLVRNDLAGKLYFLLQLIMFVNLRNFMKAECMVRIFFQECNLLLQFVGDPSSSHLLRRSQHIFRPAWESRTHSHFWRHQHWCAGRSV